MKLNASPFHAVTGELLPAYRDAYLRGDLSSKNTEAVDAYIKANSRCADETLRRFYEMKNLGHDVLPVGWVQRQFDLIRTEPQRFRQRAAAMVISGALIGGAVFAGSSRPTTEANAAPAANLTTALAPTAEIEAANSMLRVSTVRGRILDEEGKPLVGATIMQKGSFYGVSTDAKGEYLLRVPANQPITLQYGYGGYTDEEVQVKGGRVENMTLVPREKEKKASKKRHWLFFN
ncbi:carboxypeptidase-like regulatory domain-containing protein [Hymenobacter sp. GOD-10R]|uniref:carboxypeptidase-like regulatory domain-containing protein n=1 Tax=Hymenobacter sp. GOD-10R TaxID=3093922 RepID=UPI002D77B5F1|nr:carboxypeptidase-like regulatory domain-containing protein [Hymenobacter sp. GOD-10R]WRQ29492.1 carboxypeptidase-like regulatory domain-containing protein [Hymenobacter sp. GOD-10R]